MKLTPSRVVAIMLILILAGPGAAAPSQPLQPSDLVYRGAFRLPDLGTGLGWEWSGAALTYFPDGDPHGADDGFPGSLFGTGHDWYQEVSEISIPVPVISPEKKLDALNIATTLQELADLTDGLFGELEIPRAGLEYLPAQGSQITGKLYFARAAHMGEGDTLPTHGWCELTIADSASAGLWRIGDWPNYVTGDYLFAVPRSWADRHTPGQYLVTGRFRDGGQSAQGPALFTIGPWNHGNPPPHGTTLAATPLLIYPAYPAEQDVYPDYHHSDEWTGGAWLTAGTRSAVVLAGSKGIGDCWYGCSDGRVWEPPYPDDCDDRGWWSTTFDPQIIFYDPADLAAVADGSAEPWSPQPYARLSLEEQLFHRLPDPHKERLGAVAYDRDNGLLYVLEPLVDNDRPIVHVWQIETATSDTLSPRRPRGRARFAR
jgi:hypothetical protein